jgi:hypothetical protein
MPICPMCEMVVTVTSKGYMRKHTTHLIGQLCPASGLSISGAKTYLELKGKPTIMGMFDKPQFLTGGENGLFEAGDTFWLHNARLDGEVVINGEKRTQAKLLVSRTRDSEQISVRSAGRGVVRQVSDIDQKDRSAMPIEIRLDAIPSGKGSPTIVMTPASQPPAGAIEDAPNF